LTNVYFGRRIQRVSPERFEDQCEERTRFPLPPQRPMILMTRMFSRAADKH
jgi:hypothetical protein